MSAQTYSKKWWMQSHTCQLIRDCREGQEIVDHKLLLSFVRNMGFKARYNRLRKLLKHFVKGTSAK